MGRVSEMTTPSLSPSPSLPSIPSIPSPLPLSPPSFLSPLPPLLFLPPSLFPPSPSLTDPASPCANGDVRLTGGDSRRGRLEICVGGEWGSVCGTSRWSNTEAQVVCRQLGFNDTSGELIKTEPRDGKNDMPYILD